MDLIHIIAYLIIFCPLLAGFLCLLFDRGGSIIYFFNSGFVVFLAAFLIVLLPNYKTNIISIVTDNSLSLMLNYNFGILSLFFILLISLAKFIIAIFFKDMQEIMKCKNNQQLFFALNLINFFAIIGILTTNNIINIYFFIEIYSISFYAISCYSRNVKLNKISFRYFCQSVIASLFFLFFILALLINFGSFDIDIISSSINELLLRKEQTLVISLLYIIAIIAVILKFFPFWIHFNNIKSSALSYHLSTRFLFIKVILGLYLILKFSFFLFGNFIIVDYLRLDIFILSISLILIIYSNIKIFNSNNFRTIISYYCLIYLAFILMCFALNNHDSIISSLYFIAHYCFTGLLMTLLSWLIFSNTGSYNISNLAILRNSSPFNKYYMIILVPLICCFPISFIFLAYWKLAISTFTIFHIVIISIAIILTFLSSIDLIIKMLEHSYFRIKKINKLNNLQDNIYYLISFIMLCLIIIIFILNPNLISDIFRNLSLYIK